MPAVPRLPVDMMGYWRLMGVREKGMHQRLKRIAPRLIKTRAEGLNARRETCNGIDPDPTRLSGRHSGRRRRGPDPRSTGGGGGGTP